MIHRFRTVAAIAVIVAAAAACSPPDPVGADRPDIPAVTAVPAFEFAPAINVDVAFLERADATTATDTDASTPIEVAASTRVDAKRMREHWRGSRPDFLLTLVSDARIDNPWRPPNYVALTESRLLV